MGTKAWKNSALSREATFQDRFKRLLEDVGSEYRFDGLEISKVERDFPVDRKKADIVVFLKGEIPLLFVETKKKVERPGRWKVRGLFRPLDIAVVGQVISYVAIYKDVYGFLVPFFATATPSNIAVFRTPANIKDFVNLEKAYDGDYEHAIKPGKFSELIKTCLILSGDLHLRESYIQRFLDRLAKDYLKKEILKAEPTWALIGYLRSFVDGFADACEDLLKLRMERDSTLKGELTRMEEKIGYIPDHMSLAKMMAYVLMNKMIFYKILEEKYKLRKMGALDTSSSTKFTEQLKQHFDEAIEATGDFEPIFKTGIYDMLSIPDDPKVMEYLNDFITTLDNVRVVEIGDLAGYIYEELIPAEERHQWGQFYTPPAICEMIAKWAVRSQDDNVLDPGVGSGGFQLWAYRVLLKLKTGKDALPAPRGVHERILKQLFSIDINPFPAHLTAVSLSMRNVRAPSTDMNVIVDDFFNTQPKKTYFAKVKTARGEFTRAITIPSGVNAIIGNPPYTRWVEIPEITKKAIDKTLGDTIKEYGLTGGIRGAITEAGIYVYFIIHAKGFLRENARLGMIVSNAWLQTDYGVKFTNFLLDNFRIKAVVDFSNRLFRIPLISTCVLLLEKCSKEEERKSNKTPFVFVDKDVAVDELLNLVDDPENYKGDLMVRVVDQQNLPRRSKWIQLMFTSDEIENSLLKSDKVIPLNQAFNIYRGNTKWSKYAYNHSLRPNLGPNEFFYLTEEKQKQYNLEKYSHPALTSVRYAKFLTYTKDDWKKVLKKGGKCYLFMCHKPKSELPRHVAEYITWGETNCRTKVRASREGGKICSETWVCAMREKRKEDFVGWYDLGGVMNISLFAVRHSRYKPRFVLVDFPMALYDATIAIIPKTKIRQEARKALAAYLNSTFIHLWIESHGRVVSVGPIALELSQASEMPILDIENLPDQQVDHLAKLFDKLELETRKIGGAHRRQNLERLKSTLNEIDCYIANILGLPETLVTRAWEIAEALMDRRLSGAKVAKPESVRGEEEPKIKPPKERKKQKQEELSEPLTRWME